jgi:2-oxoglutarate ferredoxin oxidoreductase subunit alpha
MEDEIASMAAIIGASVGGLKSLTATSGPGFSLMQENIGYAAMAEIPCVIVDVQRLGPSTGQPTAASQGDVMQSRWGTHGDHPIIVLSPISVAQSFELAVKAFNLSEKYRTPVILLADEIIGHMREPIDLPDLNTVEKVERLVTDSPSMYKAFRNDHGDVPAMASFGDGYRYHITGLFHDEVGFPTQRLDEIDPWLERVNHKFDQADDVLHYQMDTQPGARTAILSYGASARTARHAMKQLRARGEKVSLFTAQTIWPFPEAAVEELAESVEKIIVPEMNLGQLALEVERVAGRNKVVRVNRANGEMVTPDMILSAVEA